VTTHRPECFMPDSDRNKTIAICICRRLDAASARTIDQAVAAVEALPVIEDDAHDCTYLEPTVAQVIAAIKALTP